MTHFRSQKGSIPLPLLIAAVGIVVLLAVTSTLPVKDQLMNRLFPKDESRAASFMTPGFAETRWVQGLNSPTAMQFSPDGRLFIALQGGQLRVVKNNQLLSTPFVSLNVDSFNERGLLGIAFDPNFATNQYVYLYYTTPTNGMNRISRFTANGDVAQAGSEVVIMNLDDHGAGNHNGGAMHFGIDGKLYVATGDNATGSNAQIVTNRHGKMLRLNPVPDDTATSTDERIPSDNPATFNTSNGTLTPSGVNKAIWAVGLRNPFTFDIQPQTGRIFINDVGDNGGIRWEEINDATSGKNFGWPVAYGNDGDQNARYTKPVHTYQTPGCAITGGSFYNPPASATNVFPAQYVGKYFFSDYCSGDIRLLDPANGSVSTFASGIAAPVDIKDGPDGALYYLARDDGSVYRIIAGSVPSPTPPPSPIPGAQTITFDDKTGQNQALNGEYPSAVISWGNGTWFHSAAFGQFSTKNISFSSQGIISGTFSVLIPKRLVRITAFNGGSTASTIALACSGNTTKTVSVPAGQLMTIDTGWNTNCTSAVTVSSSNGWDTNFDDLILSDGGTSNNQAPTATISTPTAGTQYSAGQSVTFSGTGSDPEDGALAAANLNWLVEFHHNEPGSQAHIHPVLGAATPVTGTTGSFIASTDHSTVNAFYRISLTATDSQGTKTTVTRDINPRSMNLTLATSPTGLQVTLNGVPRTAPYTEGSVVGYNHEIGANTPQTLNSTNYGFTSWSDAGARIHNVTAPTANTTYTASFQATGASPVPSPVVSPSPIAGTQTIIFDDLGTDIHLNGIFPNIPIDWGNFLWHTKNVAAVNGQFTSEHLSFNAPDMTNANIIFTSPRILLSLDINNRATTGSSTVTFTCAPNPAKTVTVATTAIINFATGWTSPCTTLNVATSNTWNTRFDNLVISGSGIQPSPSVAVSPTPAPSVKPGDIDGNGRVDIFDYNTIVTNFGKTGTNIAGDLDKNGRVDIFDYNTLVTNFGK